MNLNNAFIVYGFNYIYSNNIPNKNYFSYPICQLKTDNTDIKHNSF